MRGVKRVALALLVLVVALAILAFVLENQQALTLSFMGWSTPQLPVSVFVTLSLIVGLIIGPFLGVLVGRKGHRKQTSP